MMQKHIRKQWRYQLKNGFFMKNAGNVTKSLTKRQRIDMSNIRGS